MFRFRRAAFYQSLNWCVVDKQQGEGEGGGK
jgi:hypothetical protein